VCSSDLFASAMNAHKPGRISALDGGAKGDGAADRLEYDPALRLLVVRVDKPDTLDLGWNRP
jgi:hypothetical protein